MTLSEIIVDVLAVLHPVGGEQLVVEHVGDYLEDDQYADEILRIPGAVNRALADMELRRILNRGEDEEEEEDEDELTVRVVTRVVERVSLENRDEPIGIPDRFARMLINYAVAELEQANEPGISAVYRGIYERECETARIWEAETRRQKTVETVFGF